MSETLAEVYQKHYDDVLTPIARDLEAYLHGLMQGQPRIDRVTARAKSVVSFLNKAAKVGGDKRKYQSPLLEIQDQVAARIVTFYLSDVERVQSLVSDYFGAIEDSKREPESPSEFSYEGHHYVLFLPDEALRSVDRRLAPKVFELQIKTLFQHAWSEGGHDLIYKSLVPLTREHLRRAAFTAAQAWGADRIFNELAVELHGGGTSH
jgi:ppGpp synthetase/RelA/SpoT-type nucleotidyltranferase